MITNSVNFNTSQLAKYPTCGLPDSISSQINPGYIVTITEKFNSRLGNATDTSGITVKAFLQTKFKLHTGSKWTSIGQLLGGDLRIEDDVDALVQLLTGHSLESTQLSRRVWNGSEPVRIDMELMFEAFSDIDREVLYPCAVLQAMTLPRKGTIGGIGTGGFFLIPPGPSPFKVGNFLGQGDTINIDIGGFLFFDSIVVDSADVVMETRMGTTGPVGAKVTLSLTTYEILTRDTLQNAYYNRFQLSGPTPNVNVSSTVNKAGNNILNGLAGSGTASVPTISTAAIRSASIGAGGTANLLTTLSTNAGIGIGQNLAPKLGIAVPSTDNVKFSTTTPDEIG